MCVFLANMAYSRVVWSEDKRKNDYEEVIPTCWVIEDEGKVRYPQSGLKRARQNCDPPEEDWFTYQLKKVKFSGM